LDPVFVNARFDGARIVFNASENQVAEIYGKLAEIATELVRKTDFGTVRTTISANLLQRSQPNEIMRAIIPFAKTQGRISDNTVCSIPISKIEGEQFIAQNVTYGSINTIIPRGSILRCCFDFSTIVLSRMGTNLRSEVRVIRIKKAGEPWSPRAVTLTDSIEDPEED
jgi:hypothetical protein